MRIALAQLNPTVGQIEANADRIIDAIGRAAAESAELVVFPELALLGYPPKDLLLKDDLLSRCERAVQRIAEQCTSIAALVGTVAPNSGVGLPLWNAAVFCRDGQVEDRPFLHGRSKESSIRTQELPRRRCATGWAPHASTLRDRWRRRKQRDR